MKKAQKSNPFPASSPDIPKSANRNSKKKKNDVSGSDNASVESSSSQGSNSLSGPFIFGTSLGDSESVDATRPGTDTLHPINNTPVTTSSTQSSSSSSNSSSNNNSLAGSDNSGGSLGASAHSVVTSPKTTLGNILSSDSSTQVKTGASRLDSSSESLNPSTPHPKTGASNSSATTGFGNGLSSLDSNTQSENTVPKNTTSSSFGSANPSIQVGATPPKKTITTGSSLTSVSSITQAKTVAPNNMSQYEGQSQDSASIPWSSELSFQTQEGNTETLDETQKEQDEIKHTAKNIFDQTNHLSATERDKSILSTVQNLPENQRRHVAYHCWELIGGNRENTKNNQVRSLMRHLDNGFKKFNRADTATYRGTLLAMKREALLRYVLDSYMKSPIESSMRNGNDSPVRELGSLFDLLSIEEMKDETKEAIRKRLKKINYEHASPQTLDMLLSPKDKMTNTDLFKDDPDTTARMFGVYGLAYILVSDGLMSLNDASLVIDQFKGSEHHRKMIKESLSAIPIYTTRTEPTQTSLYEKYGNNMQKSDVFVDNRFDPVSNWIHSSALLRGIKQEVKVSDKGAYRLDNTPLNGKDLARLCKDAACNKAMAAIRCTAVLIRKLRDITSKSERIEKGFHTAMKNAQKICKEGSSEKGEVITDPIPLVLMSVKDHYRLEGLELAKDTPKKMEEGEKLIRELVDALLSADPVEAFATEQMKLVEIAASFQSKDKTRFKELLTDIIRENVRFIPLTQGEIDSLSHDAGKCRASSKSLLKRLSYYEHELTIDTISQGVDFYSRKNVAAVKEKAKQFADTVVSRLLSSSTVSVSVAFGTKLVPINSDKSAEFWKFVMEKEADTLRDSLMLVGSIMSLGFFDREKLLKQYQANHIPVGDTILAKSLQEASESAKTDETKGRKTPRHAHALKLLNIDHTCAPPHNKELTGETSVEDKKRKCVNEIYNILYAYLPPNIAGWFDDYIIEPVKKFIGTLLEYGKSWYDKVKVTASDDLSKWIGNVFNYYKNDTTPSTTAPDNIFDSMKSFFGHILQKSTIQSALSYVNSFVTWICTYFRKYVDKAKAFFRYIIDRVGWIWGWVKDTTIGFVDYIRRKYEDMKDYVYMFGAGTDLCCYMRDNGGYSVLLSKDKSFSDSATMGATMSANIANFHFEPRRFIDSELDRFTAVSEFKKHIDKSDDAHDIKFELGSDTIIVSKGKLDIISSPLVEYLKTNCIDKKDGHYEIKNIKSQYSAIMRSLRYNITEEREAAMALTYLYTYFSILADPFERASGLHVDYIHPVTTKNLLSALDSIAKKVPTVVNGVDALDEVSNLADIYSKLWGFYKRTSEDIEKTKEMFANQKYSQAGFDSSGMTTFIDAVKYHDGSGLVQKWVSQMLKQKHTVNDLNIDGLLFLANYKQ